MNSAPSTSASSTEGGEWLGLALGGERLDRIRDHGVADEAVGRLAKQRRAWLRALLQAGGYIDGVAGCKRVAFAGDDLARVDADPALDPDAPVSLELLVQLDEGRAHVGGRTHGAQRVVLVHDRDAEHRHHRVADELLDRAAVALDGLAHRLEVPGHNAASRLGVEALAHRRRAGHVAEQHRHRLAYLARWGSFGELGAAGSAEAKALGIVLTAVRSRSAQRHLYRHFKPMSR